jgi:hypothetical protein
MAVTGGALLCSRWPWAASGWLEAGEKGEVVGHDRGPDVGLEVAKHAPGAARQTIGPLEARDVGLDAGAEVPELALSYLAP